MTVEELDVRLRGRMPRHCGQARQMRLRQGIEESRVGAADNTVVQAVGFGRSRRFLKRLKCPSAPSKGRGHSLVAP